MNQRLRTEIHRMAPDLAGLTFAWIATALILSMPVFPLFKFPGFDYRPLRLMVEIAATGYVTLRLGIRLLGLSPWFGPLLLGGAGLVLPRLFRAPSAETSTFLIFIGSLISWEAGWQGFLASFLKQSRLLETLRASSVVLEISSSPGRWLLLAIGTLTLLLWLTQLLQPAGRRSPAEPGGTRSSTPRAPKHA